MGLYLEDDGDYRWWVHFVVVEADGRWLDPAILPTILFIGVRVGAEWWQALPKKPGSRLQPEDLPLPLRTPRYANP
jgi:hypothetical protein